jgi:ABC-type uncharacterized transport system ATPase subunit
MTVLAYHSSCAVGLYFWTARIVVVISNPTTGMDVGAWLSVDTKLKIIE